MIGTNKFSSIFIILVAHLLALCTAQINKDPYNGDDDEMNNGRTNYMTWRDYLSLSIRFGLFIFIVCYPFVRGIRTWYLAGGRILFRRNQNGWIVGLRSQPPDLDRWLILAGYADHGRRHGPGGMRENNGTGSRKLTAEEVFALPEISAPRPDDVDIESGETDELAVTYHGNAESANDEKNTTNINDSNESQSAGKSELEMVTTATASDEGDANSTNESPSQSPSEPSSEPSTRTTTTTTTTRIFTTTMSTSCSICIDDFEEGEKIRLLPRCGHAFHTDCILPWLTERQGCCPCCKAEVICPVISETEEANERNEENESENENDNTNDNTNQNQSTSTESGTRGQRTASTGLGRSSYLSRSNSVLDRNYQAHPFVGPW